MDRKPVFDAIRPMLGRSFTADEVAGIDAALDRMLAPPVSRTLERDEIWLNRLGIPPASFF